MAGSRPCIRRCMAACWRSVTMPNMRQAMKAHGIAPIDLLVVNLYPFEATVDKGADFEECIENIDIGGPAMIRAAAKNHDDVAVVVEPPIIRPCSTNSPPTRARPRWRCAVVSRAKAYARTAAYDAAISNWFAPAQDRRAGFRAFGGRLIQPLRYGENPHQTAAFYATPDKRPGVATARQLQGKELSYNNINDTDAAYECIAEFDPERTAACVIVKHANPCGVAEGADLVSAYRKALRLRPDLGLWRHRRRQPHARCRRRARHHRNPHRSDHRARRHRRGHRHHRAAEKSAAAAGRRPARSARRGPYREDRRRRLAGAEPRQRRCRRHGL